MDALLSEYSVHEFKEVVLVRKSDSVQKSFFGECSHWLYECRIYIYKYRWVY